LTNRLSIEYAQKIGNINVLTRSRLAIEEAVTKNLMQTKIMINKRKCKNKTRENSNKKPEK
jgi:hypothetical protein